MQVQLGNPVQSQLLILTWSAVVHFNISYYHFLWSLEAARSVVQSDIYLWNLKNSSADMMPVKCQSNSGTQDDAQDDEPWIFHMKVNSDYQMISTLPHGFKGDANNQLPLPPSIPKTQLIENTLIEVIWHGNPMYPIAIAYLRCVWQVTSSGIKGSANPPLGITHHMEEEQNFTKAGHDMETISTLLALCEGSLSVHSPHKSPVIWSFDVYFVISLDLLLSLCCKPQ